MTKKQRIGDAERKLKEIGMEIDILQETIELLEPLYDKLDKKMQEYVDVDDKLKALAQERIK